MNVWLRLSRGKVQTLEILRNAIVRFGPRQIKIVYQNQDVKTVEVNFGKLTDTEITDLNTIMGNVNNMTSVNQHYGYIVTRRANHIVSVIELKKIKCIWSTAANTIAIKYED